MEVPVSESWKLQSIDHYINFALIESIDWNEMKWNEILLWLKLKKEKEEEEGKVKKWR